MAGRFGESRNSGKPGLLGSPPGARLTSPVSTLSSRVFVANVPIESVERGGDSQEGFAFVQFKNRANAVAAIQGETGTYLGGRKIKCELTKNESAGHPGIDRTLIGKDIVIGDLDDRDNNGGRGRSQNGGNNTLSQREEVKPNCEQSEQNWDADTNLSPLKPPAHQASKQDHSLTLELFLNKSKKANKLVPFKKKEKSPEKSVTTSTKVDISPEKSGPTLNTAELRSSVFSDFKFAESVSAKPRGPESGPFEELWNSDFSDEFEDESRLEGKEDKGRLWEADKVREDPILSRPSDKKLDQTNISPRQVVGVEIPANLISRNQNQSLEKSGLDRSSGRPAGNDNEAWDDDNEPPFVMPTGKQELRSSGKGSIIKGATKETPPSMRVQDDAGGMSVRNQNVQEDDEWDEEIDVVTTPPLGELLSADNHTRFKDESMWGEETEHTRAKDQSAPPDSGAISLVKKVKDDDNVQAEVNSSSSQANKPSLNNAGIHSHDGAKEHVSTMPTAVTHSIPSTGVSPMIPVSRVYVQIPAPAPTSLVQSQPSFVSPEPRMASNYRHVTMSPVSPSPPPSVVVPPPTSPLMTTPPPPIMQQQQTYSSIPPMMPTRASQNITYGSLYPSRPVGGTVGGYMAYNVSMGGQPMYQQGQPVGQLGRPEPPSPPMPSNPVLPANPTLSGPQGYNSMYMQTQAKTYAPPPSPGRTGQRERHLSGPSMQQTGFQQQQVNTYTTPPSPGPTGQRERHLSGPSMQQTGFQQQQVKSYAPPPSPGPTGQPSSGFQQQQGGQTVSRMTTSYLGSSHPYGMGMKNLTMSASAPLEQQIGFKRTCHFPHRH
ncbi:uncharacterized protein [Amphiura filiformis]|uniref:uncharacterized protein n=1 Tax=Amphiura filiformis TaxID=82378 RepID=UPI003B2113FE